MGHSPYYPDNVTDEMIDEYFGDNGCCCANCSNHWSDGTCYCKERKVEKEYTEDEIEAMTEAEYNALISVADDEWCNDYEYDDYECYEDYDRGWDDIPEE